MHTVDSGAGGRRVGGPAVPALTEVSSVLQATRTGWFTVRAHLGDIAGPVADHRNKASGVSQ